LKPEHSEQLCPGMTKPTQSHPAAIPEDLTQIASKFLQSFQDGGIFCIQGEMGAGKTTFVHAICRQFGVEFAGSPTFSLVNEYTSASGHRIYHFDLYRLKSCEEALDIGMDEYLLSEGYLFIEWPDVITALLPETSHCIIIRETNGIRNIEF
jgi:tRNA threonylcarbamoyladenosine biosynthesis protein TsaE